MFPPTTIILILLASLPFASPFAILNYTRFGCGTDIDLFSANSTYSSTLDNLLSNLSSSSLSAGFTTYASKSSTSEIRQTGIYNTLESVYGLTLCRGDISSFNCTSCISAAIASLRSNCLLKKEAVVWREWCTLRYSDRDISSKLEVEPNATLRNVNVVSGDSWWESLNATLSNVTGNAAVGGFATEVVSYASRKIYALAQCTPDLTEDECRNCFRVAVGMLWVTREGSIALLPSCNVRYEMYPFYYTKTDTTAFDYPLPPAPLPSPNEYDVKADLGGIRRASYSKVVIAVIALLAVVLVVLIWIFTHHLRRRISVSAPPGRKRSGRLLYIPRSLSFDFSSVRPIEYDFRAIQDATKDFSMDNKIGHGGFGVVYKGELGKGRQKIAVKKLDKRGQDFKSEIVSLANVQHLNLVKLLGYCSTTEESLLVYEYVPNHNLSYFLFDPTKQGLLDWPTRFKIIDGIAQGMHYLHEKSCPRIIHRDLKANNILLDMNMCSKIGDFGLARIFGADQTHEITVNSAGTKGYMAPEYMLHGECSLGSDVYSFGVLVLEIVSGKENTSFHETGLAGDLLSYAWEKWIQNTPLALLDPTLAETSSHSSDQVISCIRIAISCIQKEKDKRPRMSTIVSLLGQSASNSLPKPQQPYHYYPRTDLEPDQAADRPAQYNSINQVTITELEAR